jgi:hypothetical protein
VILLELTDREFAFGLNIFECPDVADLVAVTDTRAQVVQIFRKVWGEGKAASWGPQLEDLLRNIAHTLIENPGYTLLEVPHLLYDETFRARLVANITNPVVREFWEHDYDPLKNEDQRKLRASTLNKVRAFMADALLRHIVGQSQSTIDFRSILQTARILLIKLSARHEDNTKLLGSTIVARILNAALARAEIPESERVHFSLYADEFHWFATPDFATLLTQVRKYKVATTIAHQFRDQLDEANKGATLQTGSLIVFQVIGKNADELADQFDHTPPPPKVIGQREIQTITTDPIHHLARNGHRNSTVASLVKEIILPLLDYAARSLSRLSMLPLNNYFNWAMEQGRRQREQGKKHWEDWDWNQEGDLLAEIASQMYDYLLFPDCKDYMPYVTTPRSMQVISHGYPIYAFDHATYKTMFSAFFAYWFWSYSNWSYETQAAGHAMAADLLIARYEDTEIPDTPVMTEMFNVVKNGFLTDGQGGVDELTEGQLERFRVWIEFFGRLRHIAVLLKDDPILVGSGQYEPVYDRPRSYDDVRNEIANTLAKLPQFHARVKIGNHEYTITTLPPQKQDTPVDVTAIQAASQKEYCRPRTKVEEEIRAREGDKRSLLSRGSKQGLSGPSAIIAPPAYADNIPPQRSDDDDEILSDERVW